MVDAKPFWQSKTFWTLFLAGLLQLARAFDITPEQLTQAGVIIELVLIVLAGVFRWTADGPLASSTESAIRKSSR